MDTLGPSWRTCWICETKLYQVSGKARGDPGVKNAWVEVDPSAVLHGDALEKALQLPSLPFSGLSLDLPSSSSTFGRPPLDRAPHIYSPVSPSHTPRPATLIPPVHDPFFLPPPFIPAHPHLRDLCNAAVNHLVERHIELENEVKQFISDKAREMSELEEKVRAEVEVLWNKYKVRPGAEEDLERKRSRSVSREVPVSTSPQSPPNPILRQASLQSPQQGSLLSASISANQMLAPPPPPPVADAVDDSIHEAAKAFGKDLDQRAVAMSYVFSALDETMANQARREVRRPSRRKSVDKREAEESVPEDTLGKDSWIEQERLTAANVLQEKAKEDEDVMEGTPRPAISKGLEDRRGSKGKEKARVTFEEPPAENPPEEASAVPTGETNDDEDYVFDFELDSTVSNANIAPEERRGSTDISRTRNIVEANLSTTFAADAPSHRAAWRRTQDKTPLYAALRRRESLDSDDTDDSEQISKLATSVPVSIALPARRAVSGFQLERKTSLSDRSGILVPPLKAAMREQGVGRQGRTPTSAAPPTGRRSASVSRERDAAKSFRADPGAVFESLADDVDEDEDEDGVEEDGGTLRESKTFMPPHILARNASRDAGDVGWRSMVDE